MVKRACLLFGVLLLLLSTTVSASYVNFLANGSFKDSADVKESLYVGTGSKLVPDAELETSGDIYSLGYFWAEEHIGSNIGYYSSNSDFTVHLDDDQNLDDGIDDIASFIVKNGDDKDLFKVQEEYNQFNFLYHNNPANGYLDHLAIFYKDMAYLPDSGSLKNGQFVANILSNISDVTNIDGGKDIISGLGVIYGYPYSGSGYDLKKYGGFFKGAIFAEKGIQLFYESKANVGSCTELNEGTLAYDRSGTYESGRVSVCTRVCSAVDNCVFDWRALS